jgi:nitroimidazol reductase NimA-like FMN-containing flavoprotein (pyridoxamine 5'-phosphate oxidase superfamily)
MNTEAPSDFSRVRRLPGRGAYDRTTIHAILDAAPHCHIGHVIDGRPVVIPTLHWREQDTVYWHGSAASRMLRANARGGEVCLTATLLDGFVLARSGFHHSANYRSVMCFGLPRLVEADEKLAALRGFIERLYPGRWDTLRPPTTQELKATSVLALPIGEASAKLRTGGPVDDEEDLALPVWAGVLPVRLVAGAPEPDPYVATGLSAPLNPIAR